VKYNYELTNRQVTMAWEFRASKSLHLAFARSLFIVPSATQDELEDWYQNTVLSADYLCRLLTGADYRNVSTSGSMYSVGTYFNRTRSESMVLTDRNLGLRRTKRIACLHCLARSSQEWELLRSYLK
jgi:hypothetical protein